MGEHVNLNGLYDNTKECKNERFTFEIKKGRRPAPCLVFFPSIL